MRRLLDSGSRCAESVRPPATDTTAGMVAVIKNGLCDPYNVQQKVQIVRTDLQPFAEKKDTSVNFRLSSSVSSRYTYGRRHQCNGGPYHQNFGKQRRSQETKGCIGHDHPVFANQGLARFLTSAIQQLVRLKAEGSLRASNFENQHAKSADGHVRSRHSS